jgi:hypothetical protein
VSQGEFRRGLLDDLEALGRFEDLRSWKRDEQIAKLSEGFFHFVAGII